MSAKVISIATGRERTPGGFARLLKSTAGVTREQFNRAVELMDRRNRHKVVPLASYRRKEQ